MKIHYSLKICLMALICTFVLATSTEAFFFLPPGPFSPTLDIAADAGGATKAGGDVATSGIEKIQQTINTQVDKIKSFATKVQEKVDKAKEKVDEFKKKAENWVGDKLSKFTGALHKKEKGDSVVASARTIEEGKIKIGTEEEIVTAFEDLFGKYPVEFLEKYPNYQEGIKKKYEDKAIEFSNDAMIELHIAVRSLDERMKLLDEEIEGMPDKYVTGDAASTESSDEVGGEASEANDDLGSWQNYYHVSSVYDSVVRITEELSALEAQYEAAQSMRGGVAPIDPREEEASDTEAGADKNAANDVYFEFSISDKSSFAQEEVDNGGIKLRKLKIKNPAWEYVQTKPRVAKSPFEGAAGNFNDMADIKNLSLEINKAITAHNLKQRLHTYKGPFVEYNRMKELHEKAIEALAYANGAVVDYLGRYYYNPVEVWFGKGCNISGTKVFCNRGIEATRENLRNLSVGDMLCDNDKTKICSSYSVNRYETMAGLSGYTLALYKATKAEKTIDITEETVDKDGNTIKEYEFVTNVNKSVEIKKTNNLSDDVTASTSTKNKKEMQEAEDKNNSDQSNGADGRAMVRPSKEVELEENEREMDILPWQIGAEVSKLIGSGMSNGDSDEYGTFKKKFMLWGDEIYFYDQYLENKYKNMEVYVQNMNLTQIAANVADAIIGQIEGKQKPVEPCEEEDPEKCPEPDPNEYVQGVEVNYLNSYLSDGISQIRSGLPLEKEETAIYVLQKKLKASIEAEKQAFFAAKEKLEARIINLYAKLDEVNVALNEAKKLYNATMEEYVQAKGKISGEDTMVEVSNKRKQKSKHIKDGYADWAEYNKNKYKNEAVVLAKKLEELAKDIEKKQNNIDGYESSIEDAQNAIIDLKNIYAEKIAKLEYAKETQLSGAYNTIKSREAIKLSKYVRPEASMKGRIFSEVVSMADSAVAQAKANAIEAIRDGYAEIVEYLNNDGYNPDNHKNIVNIHVKVMDKIKNPPIKLTAPLLDGYIPLEAIEAAVVQALAEAMYEKLCQEDRCLNPDVQYFVGLAPKVEDFAAPKNINESYTPPVREIVHLDSVDFDAMYLNQSKLYTINDGMLDYGYDMPQIWKTLLGSYGFVEKDVEIISHLKGDPKDNLERPGIYPCNYGNYTVDNCGSITLHKKDNRYGKCGHIKGIEVTKLLNLYKIKVDIGDKIKIKSEQDFDPMSKSVKTRCAISELKYFVHYDKKSPDGLKFSYKLEEAMDFLNNLDEEKMKKSSEKTKKYEAETMLYTKNQIGDYLGFVEYEQEYQKTLDQLQEKVKEARETIKEELAEFDYVPKEGFDLAVENDYNEVSKAIDEAKNKLVTGTCSQIMAMKSGTEALTERLEKLRGVCEALVQDSEELVSLSDNMTDSKELNGKIKAERTDRAAQEEYDKELEDAHKEKVDDFPEPYHCAY